ncbi:MAG: HPr(Ser) kinase/phosphatase [Pseudomonadota bacterium]
MPPPTRIKDLFALLGKELELKWDGNGGDRPIIRDTDEGPKEPPVGPFNMIRPNRIQIIGPPEQAHLQSLGAANYRDCLSRLFSTQPAAIIFTDNLAPYPECASLAVKTNTAFLQTPQPDYWVINYLLAYFSLPKSESTLIHGVFMEVLGKGVLISGDPGVGKSELALALVSLGHRLVADDSTEFTRTERNTITGRCPRVLQDFLEVRGLGLLNIRAMFGNSAIKPKKVLHLIIDLQSLDDKALAEMDRLNGSHSKRTILGIEIPMTTLPIAPGRNMAIQVETAIRQHLLLLDGYNAAEDFSKRQQEFIDRQSN